MSQRKYVKKKNPHRKTMFFISIVMISLTVVVMIQCIGLRAKNGEAQAKETDLKNQMMAEQQKASDLKEKEEYINSDEYIEQEAKDKLGLVYDNEIVFKEGDESTETDMSKQEESTAAEDGAETDGAAADGTTTGDGTGTDGTAQGADQPAADAAVPAQ